MSAKEVDLLSLLETLQPKFLSGKLTEREESMAQVTEALTQLPTGQLSSDEISVLLEFYCLRLQDNIVLLPYALKGILYLSCCQQFPEGCEKQIVSAVLKDQQIQSLKFDDRLLVFTLLGQLLSHRLAGLKGLGSEFVMNFVQAIDGEKDPRNLVIIFSLHLVVAKNFNLGPFVDELFEVVSCYFPIDFKPQPVGSEVNIDGSTLAVALRNCLTGCQSFSRPCLDLILENLTDDSKPTTKAEAFALLESALDVFSPESFLDYSVPLLNVIRKQALVPKSTAMESMALKCLEKLVSTVSSCGNGEVVGGNSSLKVFLGQVIKDSEPFLCNPEMSLLTPSNNLLISAARASELACRHIASKIIALLMEKCQGNREFAQEAYSEALLCWLQLLQKQSRSTAELVLSPIAESLSALLLNFVSHRSHKISQVGLAGANVIKLIYPQGISKSATIKLLRSAISTKDVHIPEAIELVHTLAKSDWSLIAADFLHQIQTNAKTEFGSEILFALVVDVNTYDSVVKSLFESFDVGCDKSAVLTAVKALLKSLKRFSDAKQISAWKVQCYPAMVQMLMRLCYRLLSPTDTSWMSKGIGEAQMLEILKHVGLISQTVVQQLDDKVSSLVDWCITAVVRGKSDDTFTKELRHECQSRMLMIIPVDYLLAAVNSSILQQHCAVITAESMQLMLDTWVHGNKYQDEVKMLLELHSARLLANVLNKCRNDDPKLIEAIETFGRHIDEMVISATTDQSTLTQLLSVFAQMGYITKALTLRGWKPYDLQFLAKLILWLNNSSIAPAVVSSLEIVLTESPEFLSINLHVNETLLYRQRIFSHFIRILLNEFKLSTPATKKYFFQTVKSLLQFAGFSSDLDAEAAKLLPLLLESVYSDDKSAILASVASVKSLLKSPVVLEFFKTHKNDFDSLIQRLLVIGTDVTSPLDLRIVVLECLQMVGKEFPAGMLFTTRKDVLKSMATSLNDHKRLVRKAACLARNQWYLC